MPRPFALWRKGWEQNDRQLNLVHLPGDHRQEEEALQAALRQLWVIENAMDEE